MPVCVIGTIFIHVIRHFVLLVPFPSASLCDKKHCYTPVSVIGTIVIRLFHNCTLFIHTFMQYFVR